MQRDESLYPADWLRIAEKDLTRVEYLLNGEDSEAAGFYLQQGLEKLFKAFLLSKGWKLIRTHDLEVLLNAAVGYNPSVEPFRPACQKITGFYLMERYPLVADAGLTEQDVRDCLDQVAELIDKLRSAVR